MRPSTILQILLPLAAAQAPFPVVTHSVATTLLTKLEDAISTYSTHAVAQAAYTTAVAEMYLECQAGEIDPGLCEAAGGDPFSLADVFLVATVTPAWYTMLPKDLQSYISSVAAAQATIIQQDESGAESLRNKPMGLEGLWMYGVAAGGILVGALLL